MLIDWVIPFFDAHGVALRRVLADRGTEFCDNPERHEYELHLAVEVDRPRQPAIERTDCPTAIPREISLRSASVKASPERFRSAGLIPPVGLKLLKMRDDGRPRGTAHRGQTLALPPAIPKLL